MVRCGASGGKTRFESKQQAFNRLVTIVLSRSGQRREKQPCRIYWHKECGGWHLTSMSRSRYAELSRTSDSM